MKRSDLYRVLVPLVAVLLLSPVAAHAQPAVQCPGDTNGDAVIDTPDPAHPNAKCIHLSSGDGFVTMADGKLQYMFGFADMTGLPPTHVMNAGVLAAALPAPTIVVNEGDELYLNLTNVGMVMRPDLFDAHTIHWHGFPQASSVMDGVPDSSLGINMGGTFTYYYQVNDPGTYMYHCHVEATEHMQMGMYGNLYVHPAQDGTPFVYKGRTYTQFVYNDGDGSTGYDVEFPVQLNAFDSKFHDASAAVQPLPFASMKDDYFMINGRGYPDTLVPGALTPPSENGGKLSQSVNSLIEANAGERILLRISNLSVTEFNTMATLGIPMTVVGKDAQLLRGPSPDGGITPGKDLYYQTNSLMVGGGESFDVILDTAGIAPGTYFFYTTNLHHLSNKNEDLGGMMTEIIIH